MILTSALCLAAVALDGGTCDDVHVSLNQPEFAPGEPIVLEVTAPAGTIAWLLNDTAPGPVVLSPDLTLGVGLSPALEIRPFTVLGTGVAVFTDVPQCARPVFASTVYSQVVAFDPVAFALCTTETVEIVGNEYDSCDPNCEECDDGILDWTLRYLGDVPAWIEVEKSGPADELVFAGFVEPFDAFTIDGGGQELPTRLDFHVDGQQVLDRVRTDCKDPVGPGAEYGPFRVLAATSTSGAPICPEDLSGDCDDGKIGGMTLRYTGNDCSASDNDQTGEDAFCSGDPSGLDEVRLVVGEKQGKVYFDGVVLVGQAITIEGSDIDEAKLRPNTRVTVYDLDDNVVQEIGFHTSCSQPLEVGDVFGSLEVEALFKVY